MFDKNLLAPVGSTGNQTHPSVWLGQAYEAVVMQFVVEAVGATPTVTWKVQASVDGQDISDGSSAWFDVAYITDASDTVAVTARTRTTVGKDVQFLSNPVARRYQKYRLVTSANTNVTYHGEISGVSA